MDNHLFEVEGKKIYRGDILYSSDYKRNPYPLKAEFKAEGEFVTMRCTNTSAVPKVMLSELSLAPTAESELYLKFKTSMRNHVNFSRLSDRDFEMWRHGIAFEQQAKLIDTKAPKF